MVVELQVHFQHSCPFLRFSKLFKDKTVYSYCSNEYDVIKLPNNITPEQLEKGKKIFPNSAGWKVISPSEGQQHVHISMECVCGLIFYHTIADLVRKHGGLPIYPILYRDGWEIRKMIFFNENDVEITLNALQAEVENLEVLERKNYSDNGLFKAQTFFMFDIFEDLTSHQISTILKAYELGYYNIPRNITLEKLAKAIGVKHKQSVNKTLRQAENKIIKSIIPFIYVREDASDISIQ